jgi:hypothetical protein
MLSFFTHAMYDARDMPNARPAARQICPLKTKGLHSSIAAPGMRNGECDEIQVTKFRQSSAFRHCTRPSENRYLTRSN